MRYLHCVYSSRATIAVVLGLIVLAVATQAAAANGAAPSLNGRDIIVVCLGLLTTVIGAYMKGLEKGIDRRFSDLNDHRIRLETKVESNEQNAQAFKHTVLREFQTKPEMAAILSAALDPLQRSLGRLEQTVDALHRRVDKGD